MEDELKYEIERLLQEYSVDDLLGAIADVLRERIDDLRATGNEMLAELIDQDRQDLERIQASRQEVNL